MIAALDRLRELRSSGVEISELKQVCDESKVLKTRLLDFAQSEMIVCIDSETFNSRIYYAGDNATLDFDEDGLHKGCITYRASELKELLSAGSEHMQVVHAIKKIFPNGKVVG